MAIALAPALIGIASAQTPPARPAYAGTTPGGSSRSFHSATAAKGRYEILVGASSRDIRLTGSVGSRARHC